MSASKKLVMEQSTVNIKKFTEIKRYLKTFNIFYIGTSFCVQGTFFSRNSCLEKGSKHFTCFTFVSAKGLNIIFEDVISEILILILILFL